MRLVQTKGRQRGFFLSLILLAFASAWPGRAASLLSNPGLESSQTLVGWNAYGGNAYTITSPSLAHSGTNYFKVYQSFSGAVNYTGIYQDYISGAGAVYSANGWAYTSSSDTVAGQNVAWIEIAFRDASANILALYRSAMIATNIVASGAFPKNTWVNLSVTNQYNPNTLQITNSAKTLVAPVGTYFVRYQVVFQGDANYSGGSLYFDDLTLTQTGGAPYGNWNIIWSDEFNSSSINPNIWTYDTGAGGWGNSELEYYTSRLQNAFQAGGLLHIAARQESYNGQNYTSARLKTQGLFSCKYGRLEWRAKLPLGKGFWPALWLLGTNITTVNWPGCGEIDVVENRGSQPNTVQGSLHSGSDETAVYNLPDNGSVADFHTYTLDWSTNAILFYVDGHLYQSQSIWSSSVGAYPAPFNQPFFIIMNIAVGGQYLGNPSQSDINTNTVFPGEMQVDYVRLMSPTAPLTLSISATNSSLLLNWPSNIICHLQAQVAPVSAGLQTNWSDLSATQSPMLIQPTGQSAFYRLSSP
jgi:beta-glucanase (GH16 family)